MRQTKKRHISCLAHPQFPCCKSSRVMIFTPPRWKYERGPVKSQSATEQRESRCPHLEPSAINEHKRNAVTETSAHDHVVYCPPFSPYLLLILVPSPVAQWLVSVPLQNPRYNEYRPQSVLGLKHLGQETLFLPTKILLPNCQNVFPQSHHLSPVQLLDIDLDKGYGSFGRLINSTASLKECQQSAFSVRAAIS